MADGRPGCTRACPGAVCVRTEGRVLLGSGGQCQSAPICFWGSASKLVKGNIYEFLTISRAAVHPHVSGAQHGTRGVSSPCSCCGPVGRCSRWSLRSSCQPEALSSRDPESSASLGREGRGEGEGVDREERGETQERGVERIVRPLLMGQAGTLPLALSHTAVSVCRGQCGPLCVQEHEEVTNVGGARRRGWTHPRLLLLDKMSISPLSRPWKRVCCRQAPAGAEQGMISVLLALLCPGLCRPFLHDGSSTEPPRVKDPVREAESQALNPPGSGSTWS